MAREIINVGATANDGTGDGLRTAYIKCNNNFKSLFDTTVTPTEIINGTSKMAVADSANVTITIAGSANVVNFAGTVSEFTGNISATGDISAGNSLTVTQDVTIGDQLIVTGTFGSNVLPDTNNTRYLGNATLRFAQVNSVLMNASGNITSTANIAGANIIASKDVIIAGNHVTTGNVTSTGNISGGNLLTGGRVVATGNVVSSANVSGLNIISTGTGNIIAGAFFKGDGGFLSNVTAASNVAVTQIANGTSVVGISSSGGNVELTSGGTLAFQTNGTNLDILIPTTSAANVTTTGNVSGGNILTGGAVIATGAVTGATLAGAGSAITALNGTNIASGTVAAARVATLNQDTTGTAAIATTVTVTDESSDTTCFPLFATAATGDLGPKSGTNLTFNSNTGALAATSIAGDGSALTALNGTNISSGTVAAARVATLNQNTTGTAGGLSSAVTVSLTGAVTGSATFTSAGDTASITTTATSDPTITLAGDLTGSATLTNLGDATLTATIAANSVALSTDTTGNYVQQGATSGVGLSGSVNSEGGTFTVTSNATDANTASTIVARDGSGNFTAGVITATATQARYADIAENYLADHEYLPGTVVSIGGVHEITECGLGDYPVGVISTDPAYLMNSELTAGLSVALVGRVPVRVFGSITKGQKVYSDIMGRASKNSEGSLVGIALEDNADDGEKLVECMLKV